MSANKTHKIDIESVIKALIEGLTYRKIASINGVSLSALSDFLMQPEHSARVREALLSSANIIADMAEEVLMEAPDSAIEIARARELAQHYRWKAKCRNPKRYGDKLDIDANISGSLTWNEVKTYDTDKKTD